MKRVFLLAVLPVVLSALERVNLIKDAGFEKGSEIWETYTGSYGISDSAIANSHDSERAFQGFFSGSCDTRKIPTGSIGDSAVVIQAFCVGKKVSDLDSLGLKYSIIPVDDDFGKTLVAYAGLCLNAGKYNELFAYYAFKEGSVPIGPTPSFKLLDIQIFPGDTDWYPLSRNIHADLLGQGFSEDDAVDSFCFWGGGLIYPPWRGQKIYWDAIRLTGYADYDVGVKEILSGDSVWAGVDYTPAARIKNFGRQAADDFLAIAEIRQGETLVWADTIPYTLPADTEDTLEFATWEYPEHCTLTVRTEVPAPGLDESDEDDALSQWIAIIGVNEQAASTPATLEVSSLSANPRISYSLPDGQSGTISIYDATGRRLESLKVQGSGEVEFSAQSSGVYFVWLEAGSSAITRKAVIK